MYFNQTHNLWKFGEDRILQTWLLVNYVWNWSKNAIKSNGIPYFAVSSGISKHKNLCTDQIHILWKFGEDMCYQTQMSLIFVIFCFYYEVGFSTKSPRDLEVIFLHWSRDCENFCMYVWLCVCMCVCMCLYVITLQVAISIPMIPNLVHR